MAQFKVMNSTTVIVKRHAFSEDEHYEARCLGIPYNAELRAFVIDVRYVHIKALKHFLNFIMRPVMTSPLHAKDKEYITRTVKSMYRQNYEDFIAKYSNRMKYSRELYEHQKMTLFYSINRRVNLWALDMGLGKTITSATLSRITGARRTVILCPTLVKWNWFEDMTKEWGYNPMYWSILDRQKEIIAFDEKFVVLNYEQLKNRMDYLLSREVSHVIIDECHTYKNISSGRSKELMKFLHQIPKARVTLLTGTPITNRVNDLYAYLRIAGHPLGVSKKGFEDSYTIKVGARGGKIIGAKNIPELKGRISNLMIRLKSEDCLDLPPLRIQNLYLEANELSQEYQEQLRLLKERKERYDSLHGVDKQKMNHEISNNIHTLNRIVATSKVPLVKQFVDGLIEEGEKVIIFSSYRDPINQLEELYKGRCVKIDGEVSPLKRQELINRFKNDKRCMVYLANMTAGGIGVNLVNSRTVINMNFPFTPDKFEQALKRAHRSGQKRNVTVHNTVARGTIDEHVYALMSDKAEDINDIVDNNSKHTINYASLPTLLMRRLLG
jgi:SNF2 family DNA or RNA helicase